MHTQPYVTYPDKTIAAYADAAMEEDVEKLTDAATAVRRMCWHNSDMAGRAPCFFAEAMYRALIGRADLYALFMARDPSFAEKAFDAVSEKLNERAASKLIR